LLHGQFSNNNFQIISKFSNQIKIFSAKSLTFEAMSIERHVKANVSIVSASIKAQTVAMDPAQGTDSLRAVWNATKLSSIVHAI
jgi:hypothetical protein